MRIDFVADVACPWCAIGLAALERALERIGPGLDVQIHMQPFELNPGMPPEGEEVAAYLKGKFGMSDEQLAAGQAQLAARGQAEGFAFGQRKYVWNTFDAHRILRWAGTEGAPGTQLALKRAMFAAYHGEGRNPSAPDVLLELVAAVGLPVDRAREVLDSDAFADEVRAAEQFWQEIGIHAVPAVVINRKHLISGGQPSAVFERALRELATEET
ncbi:MAG TPA: DsbA family oxidoreductase [Gammaproteobacteria bacterium]|jgi:predicted DsbA family dithiol-disulfide isomerase|nr:DsbA family oxidoreductase [Gammaproteobacteria bacterium]